MEVQWSLLSPWVGPMHNASHMWFFLIVCHCLGSNRTFISTFVGRLSSSNCGLNMLVTEAIIISVILQYVCYSGPSKAAFLLGGWLCEIQGRNPQRNPFYPQPMDNLQHLDPRKQELFEARFLGQNKAANSSNPSMSVKVGLVWSTSPFCALEFIFVAMLTCSAQV